MDCSLNGYPLTKLYLLFYFFISYSYLSYLELLKMRFLFKSFSSLSRCVFTDCSCWSLLWAMMDLLKLVIGYLCLIGSSLSLVLLIFYWMSISLSTLSKIHPYRIYFIILLLFFIILLGETKSFGRVRKALS